MDLAIIPDASENFTLSEPIKNCAKPIVEIFPPSSLTLDMGGEFVIATTSIKGMHLLNSTVGIAFRKSERANIGAFSCFENQGRYESANPLFVWPPRSW